MLRCHLKPQIANLVIACETSTAHCSRQHFDHPNNALILNGDEIWNSVPYYFFNAHPYPVGRRWTVREEAAFRIDPLPQHQETGHVGNLYPPNFQINCPILEVHSTGNKPPHRSAATRCPQRQFLDPTLRFNKNLLICQSAAAKCAIWSAYAFWKAGRAVARAR